jgi:hypothetical protein
MCSQQHHQFLSNYALPSRLPGSYISESIFETYMFFMFGVNSSTLGLVSHVSQWVLGRCGSTPVGDSMPVRIHNSYPLFRLALDWVRAITHVQSQGINCTKRVFKNQLCLVTGSRPEVIAHNLLVGYDT